MKRLENGFLRCLSGIAAWLGSLLLLSFVTFFVASQAPGDPLRAYYGEKAEKLLPEERALAEEKLGLDDPLPVQYVRWLYQALHGDFGISYQYKTDTAKIVWERLPNTLLLGGTGYALLFVLSLAVGVFCALHAHTAADRILCRIGTLSCCVPEFFVSLFLILVFSVLLRWFPGSGAYCVGESGNAVDRLHHLVLPLLVVVQGHLWYFAYMIRNRLLEEMQAEYVLLARAKGMPFGRIVIGHCLRHVLPAWLHLMAVSFPHILGGTCVVETVFSYPGIGLLAYESARYQDYPMLMLLTLLSGALVMAAGALSRELERRLDPRLREETDDEA